MRRRIALGLALAAALVVISSQTHLFYRDSFSTHYPVRVVSAAMLRAAEIPLWNRFAGGGQPLGGNPNTLTFYPDSILYLVLPAHVAFNLHFWLHVVAGFFAMRALLNALGCSARGALAGASLYTLSGVVVSALAFYNLVTAIALVPFVFLTIERLVERPTIRRAMLMGAAFGLLALAGEPVMIVAVAISAIVLSARWLRREVVALSALAIAVAAVIASPLLIAYSEIASETERAARAYSTETVLAASLSPARFLEMLIGSLERAGSPQLFLSVFTGAIAIPALFAATLRRYVVLAGVLSFVALGSHNTIVVALFDRVDALRIVRYPEKLAIPLTVVLVVLIAFWLDRDVDSRRARGAAIAGAVLLLLVLPRFFAPALVAIATLAAVALGRHRLALGLTFAILALIAIVKAPIDWTEPYRDPSELAVAAKGKRVFAEQAISTDPNIRMQYRSAAALIEPVFGAAHGVRYALDRSPEGMYSYLSRIVEERMRGGSADLKVRYLRMTGCERVISRAPIAHPALRLAQAFQSERERAYFYEVSGANPRAWLVTRTFGAPTIQDAVRAIEGASFDPRHFAVTPRRETPTGAGRILAVLDSAQSLSIEIDASAPATLIVNESYFTAWRATIGGEDLSTFPANIDRLGIAIPAGRSTVHVEFGRRRALIALAWIVSIVALIACSVMSIRA